MTTIHRFHCSYLSLSLSLSLSLTHTHTHTHTHTQQPDQSEIILTPEKRDIKNSQALKGYYKISRHYKWALGQVFDEMNYQYVLIVEGEGGGVIGWRVRAEHFCSLR